MKFRSATLDDVDLLISWQDNPHVKRAFGADKGYDWEIELSSPVEWQKLLIAEHNDRPVGFMEISDPAREDTNYWNIREENHRAIDIWIGDEKDLNKGYGSWMLQIALRCCFEDRAVVAVLVDPLAKNVRAHRFYQRFGFRFLEMRRFDKEDCFVFRLNRADWKMTV